MLSLIIVLVVNKTPVPNQEIVLQAANTNVSLHTSSKVITLIKERLQTLGVEDVKVKEESGTLKIQYYSLQNVAIVKQIVADNSILLSDVVSIDDDNEAPKSSDTNTYKLKVSKIQKESNSDSGVNGLPVVQTKQEFDKSSNTSLKFTSNSVNTPQLTYNYILALKIQQNITIVLDNTSTKIPDVRAGPVTS